MAKENPENSSASKAKLLSISLIVSALIVSVSLFIAADTIGSKIGVIADSVAGIPRGTGGGGSANDGAGSPVAAPQGPDPSPQPGSGSIEMQALIQGAAATQGSTDALVVIVEYSDYQCPFCRSWYNNSKSQLESEYINSGKVLFVYKDFPLSFHPMAQAYAEAARCAGDQGSYWEFHDKIFDEQGKFGQGTVSSITAEDVKNWAQELGLDTAGFNSCLDSGKYAQAVGENFSEGGRIGVSGTPTFAIGNADGEGQLLVGAQPYSAFKSAIDALLG